MAKCWRCETEYQPASGPWCGGREQCDVCAAFNPPEISELWAELRNIDQDLESLHDERRGIVALLRARGERVGG